MGPEGLRVGIFVSSLNDQLKTLFFFFFKEICSLYIHSNYFGI